MRDAVDKEEQFYFTVQEILFTETILESEIVQQALKENDWKGDIFSITPYNEDFWKNYNVLLESEEEEQLIEDLTRQASLFNKQ